jgi:hypothetical protein
MNLNKGHTFHIPVLGLGYSIDTPVKVAHLGISSVISLVDDLLMEKMREFYSEKFEIPFQEISDKIEDFRAKRITAYLDLVDHVVKSKFEELKNSFHQQSSDFHKYIELLPDSSEIKEQFHKFRRNNMKEFKEWVHKNLTAGSIDVNIMTKLDKENYKDNVKLPAEYNDAHAALRGYANSTLASGLVLSAGLSPRLYAYLEKFEDFYPDEAGNIKKKLILKVSDYRSALVQGKFLAKKGMWVSEYRIESGLNCGGHSFVANGVLMGPVLEQFKNNREEFQQSIYEVYSHALKDKKRVCPETAPELKITAQGGVGTADEHQFLLDHYGVDSVGWGTPFLLVPEVTNVDEETLKLLSEATEEDLYLSNISPLGIPFNSVRGNSKDAEKAEAILKGKPGTACNKMYAKFNTEFTDKAICTASRQYQRLKLNELADKSLSEQEYQAEFDDIVAKACICNGLGTTALQVNEINTEFEGNGVTICPGPNMAYFSRPVTFKEMVDHIYGRTNIIERTDRKNMFVKELLLYINYLNTKSKEMKDTVSSKQEEFLEGFRKDLSEGIAYYKTLFAELKGKYAHSKAELLTDLKKLEEKLEKIKLSALSEVR